MMDDEEIERRAMRYLALSALGDFLLLLGLLFMFLGTAAYLSDYFGIKGSGEASVGVLLVGAAFALFIGGRMAFPLQGRPPKTPPDAETYR